jgi:hypothetical protein
MSQVYVQMDYKMINVINYSQIHLDNLTTVLHLDVFEAMNIIQSCWLLGFLAFGHC